MSKKIELREDSLREFIWDAKVHTYAADGQRTKRKFIRSYRYIIGDWVYEDKYTGNLLDCGIEIVRFCGYPVWSMVYRGGVLSIDQSKSKEVYEFLKKCLLLAPLDFPVRGPRKYVLNEWLYSNEIKGKIQEFHGYEAIYYDKMPIYQRRYIGGLVIDSKYKVTLLF